MFLHFLGVTGATSQHFRVATSRNCNTSRLLSHFWGATVSSGGLPLDTCVLRLSKTHHVFAFPGGNPTHLSAFSRCDFDNFQYLPATFAIRGGNPPGNPPDPSETSGNFLLSHAINVETSRMDSGGYQVTPLIRSRRLAMYLIRLQEKSIPPGYFCCSGSNPLGNPGHSEANVSKSALFGCNESRRLSITFVKHEPPEAYLPTHAFFDVQNHIML